MNINDYIQFCYNFTKNIFLFIKYDNIVGRSSNSGVFITNKCTRIKHALNRNKSYQNINKNINEYLHRDISHSFLIDLLLKS